MPASLIHTRLPRSLTPFSAALRTRPLCAVHRLVLLLPIALPASRHRSHASVMPLVPPRHHSLHCMSAHDIRRALTACPITPTSIHVACSFYSLLPPLRLIVPHLRAPALPRATRRAPRPVGRRTPTRGAPPHRRARLSHRRLLAAILAVAAPQPASAHFHKGQVMTFSGGGFILFWRTTLFLAVPAVPVAHRRECDVGVLRDGTP